MCCHQHRPSFYRNSSSPMRMLQGMNQEIMDSESDDDCSKSLRLGSNIKPESLKITVDKSSKSMRVECIQKDEHRFTSQTYQFSLPEDVDFSSVRSTLDAGVLKIEWTKQEESEDEPKCVVEKNGILRAKEITTPTEEMQDLVT